MKKSCGRNTSNSRSSAGFSLIELLIAMAVFLLMSAGAMTLIKAHVPLATTAQNQSGMNLNLQNAVAQLQIDVSNAGANFYTFWNQADTPLGMTIINCGNLSTPAAVASTGGCPAITSTSNCYTSDGNQYGPDCFDTINVFIMDPNAWGQVQGASCTDISSTNSIQVSPPPNSTQTGAALAALYKQGDQILLIHMDNGTNQYGANAFTTTQVSGSPTVSGNVVTLPIDEVPAASGALPAGSWSPTWTHDPYFITSIEDPTRITSTFCPATDWVLRMKQVITYSVNTTNIPGDPQLVRTINAGSTNPTTDVIADQVIGFKVGAFAYNTSSNQPDDESSYLFNAPAATPTGTSSTTPPGGCASNCGYDNLWPLIRSVMVSVIARTAPNPTNPFRNSFDQGPYEVQSISIAINPRNLSMRDNCYSTCPTTPF